MRFRSPNSSRSNLFLVWSLVLGHSVGASIFCPGRTEAQLRDSFERPELTWQVSKEADCGVRITVHDRPFRESHTGQSCEHFRLTVGNGTFLPLVKPIGRAPIIQEFRPTLFLKAD